MEKIPSYNSTNVEECWQDEVEDLKEKDVTPSVASDSLYSRHPDWQKMKTKDEPADDVPVEAGLTSGPMENSTGSSVKVEGYWQDEAYKVESVNLSVMEQSPCSSHPDWRAEKKDEPADDVSVDAGSPSVDGKTGNIIQMEDHWPVEVIIDDGTKEGVATNVLPDLLSSSLERRPVAAMEEQGAEEAGPSGQFHHQQNKIELKVEYHEDVNEFMNTTKMSSTPHNDLMIRTASEEHTSCSLDSNSLKTSTYTSSEMFQKDSGKGTHIVNKITCTICVKEFSRLDHYKRHMRTHTGEAPYVCSFCDYRSSRPDHLKKHIMRTHSQLLSSSLEQQPVSTIEEQAGTSGESSHLQKKIRLGVDDEDVSDVNTTTLWRTTLDNPSMPTTVEEHSSCPADSNSLNTSTSSTFKSRKNCHKGSGQVAQIEVKPYLCSVCLKEFTRLDHYKRHMSTHTGETPYACSVCDYKSSRADNLKQHMRTHTGENPYTCDLCDYKTFNSVYMKTHIMRIHSSTFLSRDIQLELDKVAQTRDKHYLCSVCVKEFNRLDHYKRHMSNHTGEKPYACDICDYKCSRSDALEQHMRTHTGEKPRACNLCTYKCGDVGSLKKHMMTHTGEKPYACTVCHYRCTQPGHLTRHMRSHTGEKPYACDLCEYKCSDPSHLKKHKRIHTGEKRYECDACDYKCSHALYLKNHKIKIHAN